MVWVQAADCHHRPDIALIAITSWEFLLRVQSEAIGLQVGALEDLVMLAPNRHSALVVSAKMVTLKLQRRKHRPEGSTLKRPCRCAELGPQFCAVCRTAGFILHRRFRPGDQLQGKNGYAFQKQLRRLLALQVVEGAESFALKSFRAGRATALASGGATWQAVLAAGEWRGLAAVRYLGVDAIDESVFMKSVLEASSDEEA